MDTSPIDPLKTWRTFFNTNKAPLLSTKVEKSDVELIAWFLLKFQASKAKKILETDIFAKV